MTVRTAATGGQRAAIANDASAGAGNWFHLVVGQARDHSAPIMWTDQAWSLPGDAPKREFSVADLDVIVRRLAACYSTSGVVARDPVAVYSATAMDYYLNHLALTSIGCIPVLVNRALPAESAVIFMERIGVVGVFCDTDGQAALAEAGGSEARIGFRRTVQELTAVTGACLPAAYPYSHDDGDPVLITHSSGTTGIPKAVPMEHRNFFSGIRYRLRLPVPKAAERVLSALPPSHNSGITQFTFSVISGLPIRVMSSQAAEAVLDAIEEFRPTMVSGFSTTFADLSESRLDGRRLDSVGLWWNSGDAAHVRHIRRLQAFGTHHRVDRNGHVKVPGSAFTDALGSSEMGHSLFNNQHQPGDPIPPRCLGRPLVFTDAVVLAPDGSQLPPGEVGMLGVKSPTLTSGYWNNSLLTARSRLRGYWLTGDIVSRDETGRFFHHDRVTDVITTATGRMYSLDAEELVIRTFPEIADCTIIGAARGNGFQEPHAFLQPDATLPRAEFEAADWTRRVNDLLCAHDMPEVAGVIVADRHDLPLGPTGKVKKWELRERLQEHAGWLEPTGAAGGVR
jgi:acyl-coenzyme A synthetase/AMP-(fatty) acid ligase